MKFAIAALTAASAAATQFWTPHKVNSMADWGMMSAPKKPESNNLSESRFKTSPSGYGGSHKSSTKGGSQGVSAYGGSHSGSAYGGGYGQTSYGDGYS